MSRIHRPRPPCWQDFHQSSMSSATSLSLQQQPAASQHRCSSRPCLCVRRTLSEDDHDVIRADHQTVDSWTAHPRRPLASKNRLHRTRIGIELDRLPHHVTTGNTSRKRRSTSAGSEYEVKSSAEIMRRCEQWLNDVRRATSTAGHIATVTTSGCQPPGVDSKLT